MKVKAVLFDMDGLLVDTETVAMEVALEVCTGLEIELSPAEQKQIIGVTAVKFFTELFKNRQIKLDVQDVVQKFHYVYENVISTNLRPFVGARSLPERVKAEGMLMAIVSGSTKKQVDIVLTHLGIKDLFDLIISAEDVSHSKPDPEGYLKAAEKLNVDPVECVVLEDAAAGVKAAKDAGMRVIGVRNNGEQDLSLADQVVNNLIEVQLPPA